jgi:hypothetical protein
LLCFERTFYQKLATQQQVSHSCNLQYIFWTAKKMVIEPTTETILWRQILYKVWRDEIMVFNLTHSQVILRYKENGSGIEPYEVDERPTKGYTTLYSGWRGNYSLLQVNYQPSKWEVEIWGWFGVRMLDMIWYDMIWYDMIWYDMIWYDMIWYDMIWYVLHLMGRPLHAYYNDNICLKHRKKPHWNPTLLYRHLGLLQKTGKQIEIFSSVEKECLGSAVLVKYHCPKLKCFPLP